MKISITILAFFFFVNLNAQILVEPVSNFKVTFVEQAGNTLSFTLDSSSIKTAQIVLLSDGKAVGETGIYEVGEKVTFNTPWVESLQIMVYPTTLDTVQGVFKKQWYCFLSKLELQSAEGLTQKN